MANDFHLEEIKNSVEYQWRKQQIHILLAAGLLIAVSTLCVLLIAMSNALELLGFYMLIWLCYMAFVWLIIGGFVLFYCSKNRYFLKNYKNFNAYEVVLDNVSVSYAYKSSVYYTVKIVDNGITKAVTTNPYFSNSCFSKFSPEAFNNKKVIGFYDGNKEKFYILKMVD